MGVWVAPLRDPCYGYEIDVASGKQDSRRTIRVGKTFPFALRNQEGAVTVEFQQNDDPERWGYRLLDLPWSSSLAKGLPVIRARVSTPLDGYAAVMAWIQVVRIHVAETSTALVPGSEKAPAGDHSWVDGPPHLRGLGVPFVSFGHCPTLFDAPASTESDIRFVADSFLTASPDALVSRRSKACFGLRWGYTTRLDEPAELIEPAPLTEYDWEQALPVLRESYPDWTFTSGWDV
jgi:hypothetical protein